MKISNYNLHSVILWRACHTSKITKVSRDFFLKPQETEMATTKDFKGVKMIPSKTDFLTILWEIGHSSVKALIRWECNSCLIILFFWEEKRIFSKNTSSRRKFWFVYRLKSDGVKWRLLVLILQNYWKKFWFWSYAFFCLYPAWWTIVGFT